MAISSLGMMPPPQLSNPKKRGQIMHSLETSLETRGGQPLLSTGTEGGNGYDSAQNNQGLWPGG